jgi:hypothetical protein
VTEVEEVDKDVFGEFVTGFGLLIQEAKQEEMLMKLAGEVEGWQAGEAGDLSERLEDVPGVWGAFLFKDGRKSKEWNVLGEIGSRSPAEVVEEGKKIPLIPERAVVIAKTFFNDVMFSIKGRIDNEEGTFHGWWYSPLQGELVMLLIENEVAGAAFLEALTREATSIFEVTERQGESMTVDYVGGLCRGRAVGWRIDSRRARGFQRDKLGKGFREGVDLA